MYKQTFGTFIEIHVCYRKLGEFKSIVDTVSKGTTVEDLAKQIGVEPTKIVPLATDKIVFYERYDLLREDCNYFVFGPVKCIEDYLYGDH